MLVAIIVVLLSSLIAGIIKAIISTGKSNKRNILHQTPPSFHYQIPMGASSLPFYISKNNQQLGPYSPEEVLTMLNSGMLQYFDMAIRQGENQWQPLNAYYIAAHQQPF